MRELCRLEFGAGAEAGARRLLGDICCSDCGVLKYLELRHSRIVQFGEEQQGVDSSALCKSEGESEDVRIRPLSCVSFFVLL